MLIGPAVAGTGHGTGRGPVTSQSHSCGCTTMVLRTSSGSAIEGFVLTFAVLISAFGPLNLLWPWVLLAGWGLGSCSPWYLWGSLGPSPSPFPVPSGFIPSGLCQGSFVCRSPLVRAVAHG